MCVYACVAFLMPYMFSFCWAIVHHFPPDRIIRIVTSEQNKRNNASRMRVTEMNKRSKRSLWSHKVARDYAERSVRESVEVRENNKA